MSHLRKRGFVFVLLALVMNALLTGIAGAQDATPLPHWTYEGEEGPDHWGELDHRFEACKAGQEQSPIDILDAASANRPDIHFNYAPSALTILNNGHTVQVNYDAGSSISIDGHEYALVQFHFHHPGEHTIAGVTYPLEMHLVHADADNNLAVVGLLIQEGVADNAAFEPVFANLPTEHVEAHLVEGAAIKAEAMLPAEQRYYTYAGSLTTPPCSEGVRWFVLTTPIALSVQQIEAFASVFELDARPVQALNSRDVVADNAADS